MLVWFEADTNSDTEVDSEKACWFWCEYWSWCARRYDADADSNALADSIRNNEVVTYDSDADADSMHLLILTRMITDTHWFESLNESWFDTNADSEEDVDSFTSYL